MSVENGERSCSCSPSLPTESDAPDSLDTSRPVGLQAE